MILEFLDRPGDTLVLRADDEGIDYLAIGLEQLRNLDPGEQATAPTFVETPEGAPAGMSELILERA